MMYHVEYWKQNNFTAQKIFYSPENILFKDAVDAAAVEDHSKARPVQSPISVSRFTEGKGFLFVFYYGEVWL